MLSGDDLEQNLILCGTARATIAAMRRFRPRLVNAAQNAKQACETKNYVGDIHLFVPSVVEVRPIGLARMPTNASSSLLIGFVGDVSFLG